MQAAASVAKGDLLSDGLIFEVPAIMSSLAAHSIK